MWGAGGHYLNADATKSALNSPEGVAAAEFVVKLFDNKWAPMSGNTLQLGNNLPNPNYFALGKEAVSGIYDIFFVNTVLPQLKGVNLGVAPVLKDKERRCWGDLGTLGIFSTTQNRAAAAKWVEFMMQPANLAFYNTVTGYIPPRASARKEWKVPPLIKRFAAAEADVRYDRDTIHYYSQNSQFLLPALQKAILHEVSPKQAMDQAASQMNQYIAQVGGQG